MAAHSPAPFTGPDTAELSAPPSFPRDALSLALAAIVIVAVAGIAVNWFVGERVKTITGSQIAVLSATQEVAFLSEQKDRVLDLAVATGEKSYLEEGMALQGRLQDSLAALESAIQLPENRAAFRAAFRSENGLRAAEDRQMLLVAAGELVRAAEMESAGRTDALRADFLHRIDEIEMRSQNFVTASRADADFWLRLNLVGNMLAIAMIGATLLLMVRRTRTWARHISRMEREARAAAKAKADFLATMSHEIRTPLNGVIGFADLLLDDRTLKPDQRRQVNLIQSAGSMLLTVVNDVLDFSRLEADRFELDEAPFALATLLDECVSIIRPMADEKGLLLAMEIDPALADWHLGDADRLRQVVLNLLNNAAKFTHAGRITVAAAFDGGSDQADDIVLTVTDTGIGIPADRIAKLFQPFTQADSGTAKHFGGTGLGLSICRRLVELMGGTIALDSTEGRGSTFTVSLTLPRTSAPETARTMASGNIAPQRILLVEDLPMNREIASAMLARSGHAVQCADSGEKALLLAAAQDFDLVLMDIQMPGMDGVEATRRIRALPGPRGRVPVLAMTANTLPQQIRSYRDAGMDGHVAKPLRQALLDRAIASVAGEGSEAAEARETQGPAFDPDTFDSIARILPPAKLSGHVDRLAALVDEAIDEDDTDALEAAAHKIVSQAGALGLFGLSLAARDVEDAVRDRADVTAAISALSEASGDIAQFLRPRLTGRAA